MACVYCFAELKAVAHIFSCTYISEHYRIIPGQEDHGQGTEETLAKLGITGLRSLACTDNVSFPATGALPYY